MRKLTREFRQLLRLHGVAVAYRDAWGETQQVPADVLAQVMTALGVPCATAEACKQSLIEIRKEVASRVLPPVQAWQSSQSQHRIVLSLPARFVPRASAPTSFCCQLSKVDGGVADQTFDPLADSNGAAVVSSWEFAPDKANLIRERILGRERLCRYRLDYRGILEPGYYQLTISRAHDGAFVGCSRIVVAPDSCYLPMVMAPAQKTTGWRAWGVAAQLYSLRSRVEQLIGDFPSLEQLVVGIAKLGGAFVGLNPLHAIPLVNNSTWSPYAPLSRELLNILYIGIEHVPEWQYLSAADRNNYLSAADSTMSDEPLAVDYQRICDYKSHVITLMHQAFVKFEIDRDTERARQFARFVSNNSDLLSCYAKCSDVEIMSADAYAYAQWLADQQLCAVVAAARKCAATSDARTAPWLGLYLDLALGGTATSVDVALNPSVYATALSMGAPPDELNLKGQSWGLVPYVPWRLRQSAYVPFIRVLRAVMRHAGAVRIDHAMSLLRVYCVPTSGEPGSGGAYLYSRVRELMAIVALESQRHQCVVIGEDLGTVPERFRELMRQCRMLSYKVLWFMQDAEGFLNPQAYEQLSLVVPTTHDLPTVAGFLVGDDNELRRLLKLFPRPEMYEQYCNRRWTDLESLLKLLAAQQLCPPDVGDLNQLVMQALKLLAFSGSALYAAPLEDLLCLRQQINVPGTTVEYPNWTAQLPLLVDEVLEHPSLKLFASTCQLAHRGRCC